MRTITSWVIASLLMLLLLSGCVGGSSKVTRYYLIDPVTFESMTNVDSSALSVEVIDLNLPQYLERFHIATRTSENRLAFSENNQWGENLRKNLIRTLSRNLTQLLSTNDVGTPLNRSASRPDYRLQLYIEQFELDIDNKVKLIARWQLTKLEQDATVAIYAAELQSETLIGNQDYDEIVAAMRRLFGQLSEQLAKSIVEQGA